MAKSSRESDNPVDTLGRLAIELGCETPPGVLERLAVYAALIQRWNRRKRIVGSRDLAEIVGVHLADCLAMAGRLQRLGQTPGTLLDVGSGAGLPGLALSILVPRFQTSLCEVSEKRVAFLHHARSVLDARFDILHEDVHLLADRLRFDHVVSRAVFEPLQWLKIGRRCVHSTGCIWIMLTQRQQEECHIDGKAFHYTVAGGRERVLLQLRGPGFT